MYHSDYSFEDKSSIIKSLNGNDIPLIEFIPYLLRDVPVINASPEYTLQLIERNFNSIPRNWRVLELCCGKGAALLYILEKYGCYGLGIDLFEPFIATAVSNARKRQLSNRCSFEVMNIKMALKLCSDFDMVICSGDNNIFSSEYEYLMALSTTCREKGFIMIEFHQSLVKYFDENILVNDFAIVDKVVHDLNETKINNSINSDLIKNRADELSVVYPQFKDLFRRFAELYTNKCSEIEKYQNTISYLIQII